MGKITADKTPGRSLLQLTAKSMRLCPNKWMAYLGGPSGSCEDLVAQAVDKKKWDVCVPERAENISRTFAMCQVLADGLFFF